MTARTTGPGRPPGSGGTPKRPTKRPATSRPKTAKENPAGLTVVDGTAALDTAADAAETGPEDVVIDLTAVETLPVEGTDETAGEPAAQAPDTGAAPSADPVGVPPIDAGVLLRAILTPSAGIANGEGLTDALTGAVPTWRLDEEPIYLETIRDLGVPAVPEADGGTGEVIVGEVVEHPADDAVEQEA